MIQEIKTNSNCQTCLFKQVVMQYLTNEQFELIYDKTIQLKFKKSETILKQGNKFTHLVFLDSGTVKFHLENESGKNIILSVAKSPILLGSSNLFNEEINLFSITALEDCSACMIDINIFKTMIHQNCGLAIKILELVSNLYKDSITNFLNLANKQVAGRVAGTLIYLSEKIYNSTEFTLILSRKEMSEFVCCSMENLIHTFSRFQKEGIIKIEEKKIFIHEMNKLKTINRVG